MTETVGTPELRTWLARSKRMLAYADEARDFIRRARSELPVNEADVGSICYLWTRADELDVTVYEALSKFDSALFDSPGEIETTRGVEVDDEIVSFQCTWSLHRPDGGFISVVLLADQATRKIEVEVRHSDGDPYCVGHGTGQSSELYEALSLAFFAVALNR